MSDDSQLLFVLTMGFVVVAAWVWIAYCEWHDWRRRRRGPPCDLR